ncbi:CHC2 zinc finger domain-containing protein [Parachlamydia sp.]|uniref:CHC2 zinc finger domain-containing protein n=1 Tax=Parachlamydia sp. TaxID=2052048 RepID=UPI003D0B3260
MIRRYPRFDVSEIKRQIRPYDFYLKEQGLDRFSHRSRQWATAGLCPFHEDSSAGSFKIHEDSGAYICFSCGVKGGDIIDFLQKKCHLSFKEAVEKLKDEWRIV